MHRKMIDQIRRCVDRRRLRMPGAQIEFLIGLARRLSALSPYGWRRRPVRLLKDGGRGNA